MRSRTKFILLSSSTVIFAGGLLLVDGCLSTPRDSSSPETVIRLVDENGSPLGGIEVARNWYDSDRNKEGSDSRITDQNGISQFAKIPASVGLFTGFWRKTYLSLGMCGPGSGTHTTIYVRYHGPCKVVPTSKPLHPAGRSYQDPDGVWFYTSTDSQSNTMANLTFPHKTKNIDYALSSSPHGP
jgi:hypothetical protein